MNVRHKRYGSVTNKDWGNIIKIVDNEESDYGKAKYSIPFLLKNGFDLVMDEYQVVLQKK